MTLQTPLPPPSLPFDPTDLMVLIGVVAGLIVVGVTLYAFFKSDIAAAMAERIRGTHRRKGVDTAGDSWKSGWISCTARSPSWPSG